MNANELKAFIKQVSKEKELDPMVVKEAIESAVISASKKNLSQFLDARTELDVETGQLHLFVVKTVANIAANPRTQISLREATKIKPGVQIGETVEVEVDPSIFGRIAAQSARQVVMQKLREAERNKVFEEFINKKGEAISASVQRFDKRDLIVSVGKAEALLPRNEIPVTARYSIGFRMKVYLLDIDLNAKGPIMKVSRTHPQLVAKLFEQEVPEIADGTVKIVNVVRDPGARTKIAVESSNPDVDPVGACVGVKGSRVQMIVRELENEKIDIVPYSTNVKQFITNALVPAQIQSININEEKRVADVIVKQGNLSLAIGKKGQNAKLAAKLTGWKLDIHSEGEEAKLASVNQEEIQRKYLEDFLTQVEALDDESRDALYASSYDNVQKLADADPSELAALLGNDDELADEIVEGAREYTEALREMTRSNFGEEYQEDAGQQPTDEEQDAPSADQAEEEQTNPDLASQTAEEGDSTQQ